MIKVEVPPKTELVQCQNEKCGAILSFAPYDVVNRRGRYTDMDALETIVCPCCKATVTVADKENGIDNRTTIPAKANDVPVMFYSHPVQNGTIQFQTVYGTTEK